MIEKILDIIEMIIFLPLIIFILCPIIFLMEVTECKGDNNGDII